MLDGLPSLKSLAHRAEISRLISPLGRVRPRVPYWHLAAHRIPTLWTLYRGLLRNAPGENVRFRITKLFQRYQHEVVPRRAHPHLVRGHKWLNIFVKAKQGDERLRAILDRYESMIAAKREKEHWKQLIHKEVDELKKPRVRLTGSYFRPTLFNGPLPRLKPQPLHITMMIKNRRLARERRQEKNTLITAWRFDLRREAQFEEALAQEVGPDNVEDVFRDHLQTWETPLSEMRQSIHEAFQLEQERTKKPYPPELLEKIKHARRAKIANKTRERMREMRGEVLASTIKRRRKGPPPHVLATMTPQRREMDKIVRSVSEVGYIGLIKKRLGFKLKNPNAGDAEMGKSEQREQLDKEAKRIEEINRQRRKSSPRNDVSET